MSTAKRRKRKARGKRKRQIIMRRLTLILIILLIVGGIYWKFGDSIHNLFLNKGQQAGTEAGTEITVWDITESVTQADTETESTEAGAYFSAVETAETFYLPDVTTSSENSEGSGSDTSAAATAVTAEEVSQLYGVSADLFPERLISSQYVVLINVDTGEIVAEKDPYTRITPASMTKILTVLVAAENIDLSKLDDSYTITNEACAYSYQNDCSSVGFMPGDVCTVKDLFYGTILPSGGDAAYSLACYTAGSHEAFVDLMNRKLEELGIAETTHFENCVGIYDENHYSTVYDMAIILKAAMDNEWCREVLSTHKYSIPATELYPDGIGISNWFLRRVEDKDFGGTVIGAKTGYVSQSGNCCASYEENNAGTDYICVTVGAAGSWKCIYDHAELYDMYAQ